MTIEPMKITLRVPSTTANLGPGFDCLGLALAQENSWTLEVTAEEEAGECRVMEIEGESAATLPRGGGHLFFATWRHIAEKGLGPDLLSGLRRAGLGARLWAYNGTPLARGLGSSAAVRVAASEAYLRLTGETKMQAWQLGSAIEGHPDNAAPAGLGGFVAGLCDQQGGWHAVPLEIHTCWQLVVAIPEFSLLTVEARRVLPKRYAKTDAIFNLARMPFLIEGLRRGEPELVSQGCDDAFHQPYRAGLIPGFSQVLEAGKRAGAAAVYLSGAGPTVAAFVDRRTGAAEAVSFAMKEAFGGNGVEALSLALEVDHRGLEISCDQLSGSDPTPLAEV